MKTKILNTPSLFLLGLNSRFCHYKNSIYSNNNAHLIKGHAHRKAIAYAIYREEMNNFIHGGSYFVND
ncbi:MAG: hypothetical protein ACTSUA_02300 [Candidatus Heimdallarchaeota archaeon]